jgi:hypothetical protein
MNRRFQISISHRPLSHQADASSQSGPFGRLRLLLSALLFAGISVGILVVAFVLGSIIAAVLWIALVIAVVGVIFQATLRPGPK